MLYSCDQSVDCIKCHSPLLEQKEDGACRCLPEYYQLGTHSDADCEEVNFDAASRCVEIKEDMYLVKSDLDCHCSPYTAHDSLVIMFNGVGQKPNIWANNYSRINSKDPGRIILYNSSPEMIEFVIDGINIFAFIANPEFIDGCDRPAFYGRMRGLIDRTTSLGVAEIKWFETVTDMSNGDSIDSCKIYLDGTKI